jgi:hypothetical protein
MVVLAGTRPGIEMAASAQFNTLTSHTVTPTPLEITGTTSFMQVNLSLTVVSDDAVNQYSLEVEDYASTVMTWTWLSAYDDTKYNTIQLDVILPFTETLDSYTFYFGAANDCTVLAEYSYCCGHVLS